MDIEDGPPLFKVLLDLRSSLPQDLCPELLFMKLLLRGEEKSREMGSGLFIHRTVSSELSQLMLLSMLATLHKGGSPPLHSGGGISPSSSPARPLCRQW